MNHQHTQLLSNKLKETLRNYTQRPPNPQRSKGLKLVSKEKSFKEQSPNTKNIITLFTDKRISSQKKMQYFFKVNF